MSKSGRGSASSSVSLMSEKSDNSRGFPLNFSNETGPPETNVNETKKMSKSGRSSASSAVSLMSEKSDNSRGFPLNFRNESGPTEKVTEKPSAVSMMSVKSDNSRGYPLNFSDEPGPPETNQTTSSVQQNQDTLMDFESEAVAFLKQALKPHKKVLSAKNKGLFEEDEQEEELPDPLVESDNEASEAALKIALHVLRKRNKDEHARTLEQSHYGELILYQRKLKTSLKRKNENLLEGMNAEQWPVPLKKIYTKIFLREGVSEGVNNEHEVRQIETAFNRRKSSELLINCEEIFQLLPKQDTPVRTVLTMGIAGIGKTVLTQKFMLDWSEGKANQDIQLLFSVPFRELNLIKNKRQSLMELLCNFSSDLKESGIKDLKKSKVLFILDGLDECRLPLDFKSNERCCDATQAASVDVLLTNLIAGNLLPKANLWITTRPAAASCIPPEYVDRVTEIRGFNSLQKEQYFHKKIKDENLAKRVIANIRSARSLYIMCHMPVFCWISSIVLGNMCAKAGGGKMPKTLTQMYIHFLAHQTTKKHVKYSEEQELDDQGNDKVIMSLGKLAFQQLEKGNLIFYEEDLRECGIDVKEASVYSGVFTQVFREESCMQQKVFCFVHLSVQEFLAALYVHVMYKVSGVNLMISSEQMTQTKPVSELYKAAVDRALQSNKGHLDLFLRFLLGLSLESSQTLLRSLKIQVETFPHDSQSHEETIKYIKERINQTPHPEKYINLFHCLNELNDLSLVEEIQSYMESDRESVMDKCSAAQWAALVFVLLTSPEKPEEIQLKKYCKKREGLQKLLPAIKASKSAMLNDCNLSAGCCETLSSILSSNSNELNHLNLSDNNLRDSGIKLLCSGLKSRHCRLKTLRLNRCSLTQICCEDLASVLSCPSSPLIELDLSHNDIEDSGVKLLCTGLENVNCKLETIRLSFCNITEKGCDFLASAVKSNPSHLGELDLSYNHLGESGVKLISEALEEGLCEFTKLRVDHNAEHWFKPGLSKHACELTVDPNTVHKLLVFSDENRKVSQSQVEQSYPDHPDRFDFWTQVLFQQGLTGRHYWEVEWEGKWAGIGVTYKDIRRKGPDQDCVMGYNEVSWSLHCSAPGYRVHHNYKSIVLQVPLAGSRRLAVYLDWEAGILSFYRVSTGGSLTHLHTFHNKFTKPLYPIFRVWGVGSSVKLLHETV